MVGTFDTWFGTYNGALLRAWCVRRGWPLAWAHLPLDSTLTSGAPPGDPFVWNHGVSPAATRILDPWVLRRVPLFLVAGDGDHVFQPVHVRDAAALLEALGDPATTGEERDACGPDAPTSLELFGALRDAVGGHGRGVEVA